jgi:hypothetical protein
MKFFKLIFLLRYFQHSKESGFELPYLYWIPKLHKNSYKDKMYMKETERRCTGTYEYMREILSVILAYRKNCAFIENRDLAKSCVGYQSYMYVSSFQITRNVLFVKKKLLSKKA